MFGLPDADNNTLYVSKNEIGLVWGREGGWSVLETVMWKDSRMRNLLLFSDFVNSPETAEGRNFNWSAWTKKWVEKN